jgi:tripartite ATP-independent transporter DctP family solute receptor
MVGVAWIGPPGCSREKTGSQIMKVGEVLPEDHPTSVAMAFFQQRLGELSGGEIEVRLFPNGQLGGANELIVDCQGGNIEAAVVSAAPLAQHVPELNVLVMPFVFRDATHRQSVLDGPTGAALRDRVSASELRAATFFDAGFRNIMTRKGPIRTPADLAGLKIRVMDSAALTEAVERLGATAIPMSQGEVYSALQTGVIDGWENNPPTCLTFSMHETGCKHFAWTRHVAIPDLLVLSRRWYDGLSEPLQKAVDQAAAETRDRQRVLWREHEARAIEELKAAGMVFTEVQADAFAGRFTGFYDAYIDRYGESFADLLTQIRGENAERDAP